MALVFPVVHAHDASLPVPTWEFLTATAIRGKDPLIPDENPPPDFFTRNSTLRNYISRPIMHNGKLHIAYTAPYDTGDKDFFGRVAYQNEDGTWDTLGSATDVINTTTHASCCTALASYDGDLYAVFAKALKSGTPPPLGGNDWPAGNTASYIYKYNESTNVWEEQYGLSTGTGSILGRELFFTYDGKLYLFFLSRTYKALTASVSNRASCAVLSGGTWTQFFGIKADNSIWSQGFSDSDMQDRIFDGRTQVIDGKVYFILRTDSLFTGSISTLWEFNTANARVEGVGWATPGKPADLNNIAYRTLFEKDGEVKVLFNLWRQVPGDLDYSNAKGAFWVADKGPGNWTDWSVTSYAKPQNNTFYFVRDFAHHDGKDYILLSMREGVSAGEGGGTYIYENDGSGWSLFGGGPIVSGSNVFDFYGYDSNTFDQKILFINGNPHVIGAVQNHPGNSSVTESSFFIAKAYL